MSNTLLHHQIKGLALAQCPVFSLSMQIFLLSDSLSYPQRVSYYLTLFHTGLTYYFHNIGYPIIYPIVTFAYRKVKKYPINNSSQNASYIKFFKRYQGPFKNNGVKEDQHEILW